MECCQLGGMENYYEPAFTEKFSGGGVQMSFTIHFFNHLIFVEPRKCEVILDKPILYLLFGIYKCIYFIYPLFKFLFLPFFSSKDLIFRHLLYYVNF